VRSCLSVTASLKELRIEGIALSQKDTGCIAKVQLWSRLRGSPLIVGGAKYVYVNINSNAANNTHYMQQTIL